MWIAWRGECEERVHAAIDDPAHGRVIASALDPIDVLAGTDAQLGNDPRKEDAIAGVERPDRDGGAVQVMDRTNAFAAERLVAAGVHAGER